MDKINTDDLLVKILSYLPTKDAVTTSILSKRWKFLWMGVPNLEYDDQNIKPSNRRRLRRFIKRKLPLHRAPVLESLRLKFSTLPFQPEDIKQWVEVAVSRCVRELSIDYSTRSFYAFYPDRGIDATLPICLYTCKSLVALKLGDAIIMDVPRFACLPSLKSLQLQRVVYNDESFRLLDVSHMVCFPSLRSLHLKEVKFFDGESLRLLLANCPDLEELIMERDYEKLGFFSIILPSLKSLSIRIDNECDCDGVEIVAPSLKYIKLEDKCNNHFLIDYMPELEEAYIEANNLDDTEKFLGSFSSVKRLTLRLSLKITEARNVSTIVFNQLESLKIYTCSPYWAILLLRLLKGSPNLKVLELYNDTIATCFNAPLVCCDQLTPVPECFLTSLETFKWTELPRTQEADDMVAYITKNSSRLKSESTHGTWSPFGSIVIY